MLRDDPGPFGNRLTRYGRGPIWVLTVGCLAFMAASAAHAVVREDPWGGAGFAVGAGLWAFVLNFFRNPTRVPPADPDVIVSPADGKVFEVTRVENEEYIDGPATRVSVFLNVFNVHVNRSPVDGVVRYVKHHAGKFHSATRPDCREVNERQSVGVEMEDGTRVVVRKIAGLIARRICCPLEEGDRLERGFDYGMIRFGSQTEISLPERPGYRLELDVAPGQGVQGGVSSIGRWVKVDAPLEVSGSTAGSAGESG